MRQPIAIQSPSMVRSAARSALSLAKAFSIELNGARGRKKEQLCTAASIALRTAGRLVPGQIVLDGDVAQFRGAFVQRTPP